MFAKKIKKEMLWLRTSYHKSAGNNMADEKCRIVLPRNRGTSTGKQIDDFPGAEKERRA